VSGERDREEGFVGEETVKKALLEIAWEEPEFIVRLLASLPRGQLARLAAVLPPKALKDALIEAIKSDRELIERIVGWRRTI
jgi:hypothetical protein